MRQRIKKLVLKLGYWTYRKVRCPILWYQKKYNIKTHGVRVILIHDNSVVLVRHWYNSLWVFPGGGINKYETPEDAAIRELKEEVGIENIQLEYLLGTYSNNREGKSDTVYCFVAFIKSPISKNNKFNIEISDIQTFDFDKLPDGTSEATRERLKEYLNNDISKEVRLWS